MTDKQVNLHPKNDSGTNLKPNIISENIPDKAVTLEKLDQNLQETIRIHGVHIDNNRADINANTDEIEKMDRSIDLVDGEITTHTSNTSNPHKVTKSQIGLGSVVNASQTATPASGSNSYFTAGGAYTLEQSIDTKANKDDVVLKANVNTGTFDPKSDNPAGQKSTADYYDAVLGDEIIRNGIVETYLYSLNRGGNIFAPRNVFQGIREMCSGRFGKDRYGNNPFFSVDWDIGGWRLNFDRAFCYAQITYFDFNSTIQYLMDNGKFSAVDTFKGAFILKEIASYDFKNCSNMNGFFGSCGNIRHIHMKNFPVSFDISASTAFEESDLVEILNNLMDLTGKTSQTLTMGAMNLAKLTDSDKAIATNKNWVLA